jgi:Icc-related predicted phosphoesterase
VGAAVTVVVGDADVAVFGTQFFWPMTTPNPHYDSIAAFPAVDIFLCHSPVAGILDGGNGCTELRKTAERLRPRLFVSGHIHNAHGQQTALGGVKFVNAANCGSQGYTISHAAEFVEILVPKRHL